jgi:ferredoxin
VDFGIRPSTRPSTSPSRTTWPQCTHCGACIAAVPVQGAHPGRGPGSRRARTCRGATAAGVCRHACSTEALALKPRDEVPAVAGQYGPWRASRARDRLLRLRRRQEVDPRSCARCLRACPPAVFTLHQSFLEHARPAGSAVLAGERAVAGRCATAA